MMTEPMINCSGRNMTSATPFSSILPDGCTVFHTLPQAFDLADLPMLGA
jgi:hypothetical protein